MRKFLLLSLAVMFAFTASAQDFSNKGKEFWFCFPNHIPSGANGQMTLWITSDLASSGTVTMTNGTFNTTFNVAANGIVAINIPHALAHISNAESGLVIQKSIKVLVDPGQPPVVAYAQQYGNARSAATLLLPKNVLGKKYFAVSFNQLNTTGGGQTAMSQFQIIATNPNTNVTITPRFNGVLQTPFTISLPNIGDMYQYQASQDITGSLIESIAGGTGGCSPIAVFSGSSATSFGIVGCTGGQTSYDPLFQQLYPTSSWGKNFGFIPFGDYPNGNPYRVLASEDNTNVYFNGILVATLNAGQIYPAAYTTTPVVLNQPTSISADKPITVAQYAQRRDCTGSNNGDPDMVVLNPIEQNIKDITIFASTQQNINRQWINVLIKTAGTASFRILDGPTQTPIPIGAFTPIANMPGYSYLSHMFQTAASTSYRLISDSGFNAICYGFQQGQFESYAYSAGTNVRDLSQQLELETTYGIETSPSVCTNSPFRFKVYFPDSTTAIPPVAIRFDSLDWKLSNPSIIVPNNFDIRVINPTIDSTNIRNGRQVNWYSLPTVYYFNAAGLDTLTITTYKTTNEGCGNVLDYEFPIQISDPPVPDFTWTASGCVADPFQFTETTPQMPKPTYQWWWNFGDPASGANNTSNLRNPTHIFSAPGTYTVRYAAITTPGCLTDTVTKTVTVEPLPDATIDGTNTVCINGALQPIVFTGTGGTAPYIFYYHITPGGVPLSVPSIGTTATIQHNPTTAGTYIYTLDSVRNQNPPVTSCVQPVSGQQITITVTPDATINLSSGAGTDNQTICINTPLTNITYAIGGSGNGASITAGGLPAGVTGVYAGGVFTISGTPTVSGVFPYTVTTAGPCVNVFISGTITVDANSTINLSSGAGTDNQTICINTPLTNITYAIAGGGTGASITAGALPAGVIGFYAGGVFTITGVPTVSGIFNYTVTTTGPCVNNSQSGTITVDANSTINLSSAAGTDAQTVCIDNPIINITYAIGGGGNGASITAGGLPAGVTGVYAAGVFTISGTPTVSGVFPYTVTTAGPCINVFLSGSITVTANSTITLSSLPSTTSQSVCKDIAIVNIVYSIGGTGTGASITVGGLPAGVTGVYAGGVFTISGTPTVSGVFPYTVTTAGPCVNPSLSGTITVYALPTPAFTFSSPSCETRTIDFTDASVANVGTVTGWAWNFDDPASGANNTSNLQNPTHTFATAGTYNVTLSVTTSNGCVSNPIATIPVTINNRPLAGFIIPEVCLSDTYAQFTDTSKVTNGTIVAWDWNFGDPGSGPLNTSTLQNPQHSYTAVGSYNVQLIATSNTGCKDTIVQVLTVNGSFPVSAFNVLNPATLCANDSVAIVNQATVFPGVITRIEIWWDDAAAGPPAPPEVDDFPFPGKVYKHLYPNFQAPLTRVFTIRFRAYSGGVCLDDSLNNITVNAAPLVQFNNMPDTCFLAAPFQITQASEIGGVPGTGVFSGPGVSPTGIFSPAIAGIGLHTIKYTFTSAAGGCVDSLSKTIRVLDTAHATFTNVTPICEGTAASFTDMSTAPAGVTLANTVWDFGDGTPLENHAPGTTFTHVFANPGTYIVTMYNVSTVGCNSTVFSKSVTVDPNHIITLTSANDNQTLCINTAIAPILYNLAGGATGVTVTGLPAGVNYALIGTVLTITGSPSTTTGSPFIYNIQTTGNTCTIASASGTIAVNPDHTITLNAGSVKDQSVCVNTAITPITYTLGGGANNVTVAGLPPGVNYVVAGNTVTISGTPTTTLPAPLFNYSIVTTGNTCLTANAGGSIRVNPYPVPMFAVDKPSYCIPNAIVTFNNSSTVADGTAMTYSWDFGDGSPLNSGFSPSHWYVTQGPFNVKLTVRSGAVLTPSGVGCVHDTTIAVTNIHPQPKADFSIDKPAGVCVGDAVTFTDNSDGKDGAINQWFWDLGDGSTRTTSSVTYTYTDTITFNVKLYTVNTPHGCNSDTITKQFTVHPYPHVNAGPDRNILEGGQIVLAPIVYGNDLQFLWTPNLYLLDNKIEKVKINKPLTDMTYTLTVTARGGCSLSDDVFIKLLKFPKIPNTFTPNGDGINDTWRIDYLNTYPDNRVQIFTRAGQLVFQSRGYDTPWDGTLKGKPLPFDTYYYIIEPGNGRDPITGYVTIIK